MKKVHGNSKDEKNVRLASQHFPKGKSHKASHPPIDSMKSILGTLFPFFAFCFVVLAAIQTQYIQEDAFIYFRTAGNISFHGEYSFNLGESYPAATSTLYAFLLAAHIRIFGDFFTLTVQVMNCGAAFLGVVLLSRSVPRALSGDKAFSSFVFWIVAISPPLITLATSGMETAFVLLGLSALIFGFSTRAGWLLALACVLLPLLRIEATIASVLVAALAALRSDWRILWWTIGGIIVGILAFLAVNLSLTGEVLPQTITAKNIVYQPPRTFEAIVGRVWTVFFERSFFLGISMKYIPAAIYIAIGAAVITLSAAILIGYAKMLSSRQRDISLQSTVTILVIGLIFIFPLGYIYGGVIFPWYLWPSGVLTYYLFARHIATAMANNVPLQVATLASVTVLSLLNLVMLTNYGYQEAQFRAEVGRFIAHEADEGDTLFLEPAGYIPFYAGLRTWDTVGLVSPDILAYRRSNNSQWWIAFVQEKQPTWIVERQPIHQSGSPDSTLPEDFTEQNRQAFAYSYELIRHFVYADYIQSNRSIMTPIYQLGGHSDYYVYRMTQLPHRF